MGDERRVTPGSGVAGMNYEIRYNAADSRWNPVEIRARLRLWGRDPMPLQNLVTVTDGPGSDWLASGRLVVRATRLEEKNTCAVIVLGFTDSQKLFTLDQFLALGSQGATIPLAVTLVPTLAIPGMGVPVPVAVPVTGSCTASFSAILPARIEVTEDRESGPGAGRQESALEAEVVLPDFIDATLEELEAIQDSIAFEPKTNAIRQLSETPVLGGKRATFGWGPTSSVNVGATSPGAVNPVRVTASIRGRPLEVLTTVTIPEVDAWLELRSDRPSVNLDGRDATAVYATVVFRDASADAERDRVVMATARLEVEPPANAWLSGPSSPPTVYPDGQAGWRLVGVDRATMTGQAPPTVARLRAVATYQGRPLRSSPFPISLEAVGGELRVSSASVTVCRGYRLEFAGRVEAEVTEPGTDAWTFDATFDPAGPEDPAIQVVPTGAKAAIHLRARQGKDPGPHWETGRTLVVTARSGTRELEPKRVEVRVVSEGLRVHEAGRADDGFYRVRADGTKTTKLIQFEVWRWSESALQLDTGAVRDLQFDWEADDTTIYTALETTGQLQSAYDTGTYWKFWLEKPLPGDGAVLRANYRVSLPGAGDDAFTKQFVVGIETLKQPPCGKGLSKEEEYEGCREIIRMVIPSERQQEFYTKLKVAANTTLDANGLCKWRHKMWKSARELTYSGVAEGYLNYANWADRITWTLEIADILGDYALTYIARYLKTQPVYLTTGKRVIVCLARRLDVISYAVDVPLDGDEWEKWFVKDCLGPIVRDLAWFSLAKKLNWTTDGKRIQYYSKEELLKLLLPCIIGYYCSRLIYHWLVGGKEFLAAGEEAGKDLAKKTVQELVVWLIFKIDTSYQFVLDGIPDRIKNLNIELIFDFVEWNTGEKEPK